MHKKPWSITLVVLMIVFLLTGCGQTGATSGSSTAAKDPESALPKLEPMEFVTGASSGTWVPIGAGIADKINKLYQGFPITAIPGPGSIGNAPVIADGKAGIGMSYGPFLLMAYNGKEPYQKPMTNLRAVAALQPTVIHAVADLKINNVDELVAKKVPAKLGLLPVGNASSYLVDRIFAAAGMKSVNDIKSYGGSIYFGDGATVSDAWQNRQINMNFRVVNVPDATTSEMILSRDGSKLINIDGNVAKTLIEQEGFEKYTIKAGTYKNQTEDIQTVGLPIVIFVTKDTDETLVYNIAKSIYNNAEALTAAHASFKEFNRNNIAKGTGIELHPGAIKFYKEIGVIK